MSTFKSFMDTLPLSSVHQEEEAVNQDWLEMYQRCFVYPWSWGVLQPDYVYFQKPLVIIDDRD